MLIHTVFDLLAACAALGMTLFVYNWRLKEAGQKIDSAGPLYGVALLSGAAIGGFGLLSTGQSSIPNLTFPALRKSSEQLRNPGEVIVRSPVDPECTSLFFSLFPGLDVVYYVR
ncbi:hypothetical protein [Aestuariivirga sp.]|uniref:hypothetical protein n=1 Tax=Aestuariivirga sp. TaxID=2650926 RepID=UPI003018460D